MHASEHIQAHAPRSLGMWLLLAWLAGLSAISAWGAAAPGAAGASAAARADERGSQVFGVTEVMPRADRALSQLRSIGEELHADTSAEAVEGRLPAFAQQLDDWWKTQGRSVEEGVSVQGASDLSWELGIRETQLDAWELLLAETSKTWVAEARKLDSLMASWRATSSALGAQAPQLVRDRTAEVLRVGDAMREQLREKAARLVAVQARLGEQREALNGIRAQLDRLRKRSKLGLLALDSAPLWTAVAGPGAVPSIDSQVVAGLQALYDPMAGFLRMVRARLALHLLVFGALVSLFFVLRRSSRKGGPIQPTAAEHFILERSFSSALFLALCCVPLIDADAGPRLVRFAVPLGLVPVFRLLPAALAPRLRIVFYALTATYLLDFLRNYLPTHWLLARLLLLAVTVFGAAGIALLARAYRRELQAENAGSGTLRALLVIGTLLFAGSLVANVAGNVSMAEYLVSPLVRVLFLGAAIRLGAVVATTVMVMALRTRLALLSRVVRERADVVAAELRRLAGVAAVVVWAYTALFSFGLLADVSAAYTVAMAQEWHVGAAVIPVRDVVNFIVIVVAAYVISRILRFVLAEEIFPRIRLSRGVPDALELLARYCVLLFGFLLALNSSGVNLSQVTLALSALGVGIGFGLQHLVNNFVSGLILVFEHPIQVGDLVEVGSHYGKVQRIGFRASVLRTRDGVDVIIPNGELIGTKVLNWTLSDRVHRVVVPVPVPVGADADRVVDILLEVARNCPMVLAEPSPRAILERFEQSSLQFALQAWVRSEDAFPARDQLALEINKAFQRAGIAIPFPQSDVHLHVADAREPAQAPAAVER